jgi:hypothetical protein
MGASKIHDNDKLGNIDGFVKSPSAALRFTFVAAAYHLSTPPSEGFARRVPRTAGELFTKLSRVPLKIINKFCKKFLTKYGGLFYKYLRIEI